MNKSFLSKLFSGKNHSNCPHCSRHSHVHEHWTADEDQPSQSYQSEENRYPSSYEENRQHYAESSGSSSCTCGVLHQRRPRIYNGERAWRQNYPWLARVYKNHYVESWGIKECVGAMITFLHLLCVAHCFDDGYQSGYAQFSNGAKSDLGIVYQHEHYDENDSLHQNDIAVVSLKERVTIGNPVIPICLPTEFEDFTGYTATTAGWGWLDEHGTDTEELHKVELPILSEAVCHESHYRHTLPDSQFCAGYMEGGPATCKGDSGAPMMVEGRKGEIITAGVVSYARGCGRPNFPGVKQKVSSFIPWIMSKIGNELLCDRP